MQKKTKGVDNDWMMHKSNLLLVVLSLSLSPLSFPFRPGAGKLGSFTTRLVWSPAVVDRLQWGDLMTKKVLGFVLIQDIVEVIEHKDDPLKFTVFTIKRSLDLEARNEQTRERWIKALRFFIEFHMQPNMVAQ